MAGGKVDPLDGAVTLLAILSVDSTITGSVHDIVAGGVALDDIDLHLDGCKPNGCKPNIIMPDGTFQGAASMGDAYTGKWGGRLYNPAPAGDESPLPLSAAGAFGVSGGEGADAMSIVGAFGAHRKQ